MSKKDEKIYIQYEVAEDRESVTNLNSELLAEDGVSKPMLHLLPPRVLMSVAEILTFGAHKYEENSWLDKPTSQRKRVSSALRHIYKHLDGEMLDDESGKCHIDHAICQLMMTSEYINRGIE